MSFIKPFVGSIIGAGGALGGAAMGAEAGENAAKIQAQSAQNALDFQKQQWAQTQANQLPFLQAGQQAIGNLSNLVAPGGALVQPWTQKFVPPTGATEANDPGYQFRLQQGMEALQRSAAAQGNLLTGGTAKDITNYAQNYASNEYQNVYNRALTEYQQQYNIFQQNQANQFNRLAAMAGVGQTATGQLGSLGLGTAANVGNLLGLQGAALGGGVMTAGNAWANALGQAGNIFGQQATLNQLARQSAYNPNYAYPGAYTGPSFPSQQS